jgi:hypothetical protein
MNRKFIGKTWIASLLWLPACGSGLGHAPSSAQNHLQASGNGTLVVNAQEIISAGAICAGIGLPGTDCKTEASQVAFAGNFRITNAVTHFSKVVNTDAASGLSPAIALPPGNYAVVYEPSDPGQSPSVYNPVLSTPGSVVIDANKAAEADMLLSVEIH